MSKYEQFKRKLLSRLDEYGHIKDGYILKICGNTVCYSYVGTDKNGEEFIYCMYYDDRIADNIYQYEVDENNEYRIEWFVLENEDE